jgi:hypothetical protein
MQNLTNQIRGKDFFKIRQEKLGRNSFNFHLKRIAGKQSVFSFRFDVFFKSFPYSFSFAENE